MYHKILNETNEVIGFSGPDPLDLEYDENWVAITEEEYNELSEKSEQQLEDLEEINIQENSQRPTYEELQEENARLLYQLLSGEEFE